MLHRSVPLVDQVIVHILAGITDGTIVQSDGLLPSEAEFAHSFGVSRATIREALAKLELGGVITRRQGIGTYVAQFARAHPASVQFWFDEAASFTDLIRSSGHEAECKILDLSIEPAGSLASPLEISSQSLVVSIERVFLASSEPVVHCVNVIPADLIEQEGLDEVIAQYQRSESVYQVLEARCGRKVDHQRSEVWAVVADDRLATLLNCQVGHPLLRVEEVGRSSDHSCLFYALNHFRGDTVSLLSVRRVTPSITPPELG